MQCPNCNNPVPDTANVCGYCGTRLRQPAQIPSPASIQPPSQPIAITPQVQAPPPPSAPVAPVYIPPVPPTPVSTRRKIPAWAWIVGIFICLGLSAILIWAVFFSNINIDFGSSPPTQFPTIAVQSQPQTTPVPPKPTTVVVMPSRTSPPPTLKPFVQVEPINPNDRGDLPGLVSLANEQNRIELSTTQAVYISWGWCATTPAIKEQNMEHISISFLFNQETIPLSQFYVYESKNSDGKFCRSYAGVISAWPVGQHTFEYVMTTDAAINDGISDFPKGEMSRHTYTLKINP